jgi:hypothetical protein
MPARPSELNDRFSRSTLSGQFLLCRSGTLIPQGWREDRFADWIIGSHPKLLVSRFGSEAAGLHGWVIGYAVDALERRFVFGPDHTATVPLLSRFHDLERWMADLTGQYVIIAFTSSEGRLYLDAAGARSVIWCSHQRVCASSSALVPYDELTHDDVDLIQALGIPETAFFFPFGLTPRHKINRLLPNHYLDLGAWDAVRHWPLTPVPSVTPHHAVDELIQRLSGVIQAVCENSEPLMSLTAGRDSRMLLACAKALVSQIQFFTWELPDATAKVDLQVAETLKRACGLRHKVYQFHEATSHDKAEWLYRTGCAVGEPRGMSLVTTNRLMKHRFYLPALGSEVGRAFYWKASDRADTKLSAEELLARLKHPIVPRLVERAASWLDAVPVEKTFDILDLLYIEQRLGCWAGVWDLGWADGPLRLPPFYNRRIFTLLLGLPYDYRIKQQLASDLIQRSDWPELLNFAPFNPKTKDFRNRLREALRNVRLLRWLLRSIR